MTHRTTYSKYILAYLKRKYIKSILIVYPFLIFCSAVATNILIYTETKLIINQSINEIKNYIQGNDEVELIKELKKLQDNSGIKSIELKSNLYNYINSTIASKNISTSSIPLYPLSKWFELKVSIATSNDSNPAFHIITISDTHYYGKTIFIPLVLVISIILILTIALQYNQKINSDYLAKPVQEIIDIIKSSNHPPLLNTLPPEYLNLSEIYELSAKIDHGTELFFEKGELLERQSKSKNEFTRLNQVIHDLKSPLSAISIIVEKLNGPEKDLSKIALNRINTIFNETKSHDVNMNNHQFVDAEYIDTLSRMLVKELQLKFKNVLFSLNINIDKHAKINFSRNILMRAMANLLYNAAEAVELLPDAKVTLNVKNNTSSITFSIIDNGKGISESIRGKIIQEPVSSIKNNGQGIGLYGTNKMLMDWGTKLTLIKTDSNGTHMEFSITDPKQSLAKIN